MFSYFLKKRLKKHDAINNIKLAGLVRAAFLQHSALNSSTTGVGNKMPEQIVVSLTSFHKRIEDIYLCIESLFQQSLQADHIILWLSETNFPGKIIPESLRKQQNRGLEIVFVEEDLGPYKKYFYAFERHPNSLIITVDDDILYPQDMIDMLYRAYIKNPDYIHCHRAHQMLFGRNGNIRPYQAWNTGNINSTPSLRVFPTGMGGVLYFPGSLDPDAFKKEKFMALCPNADDIWLKAMSIQKGTPCKKVDDERPWKTRFLIIEGTQGDALKRINWRRKGGNDSKIKTVFTEYDIYSLLKAELTEPKQ